MRAMTRKPVHKVRYHTDSGDITTGAWVEVIAAMPQPSSQVEIRNTTGSVLEISLQAAGEEDTKPTVPYYIMPDGSPIILPIEFPKNRRVSVRAVDVDATDGALIMNFFE